MSAPQSIACCINFYNDAEALAGALECAAPFFDNIFTINAGPGGARSTDGSIELCEKFGATVVFDDIQRGFGVIRSRLIHDCGCSWGFILDSDERFFPSLPVMHCEGTDRYPEVQEPNLSAFKREEMCNQGALLKRLIQNPEYMAIRSHRRHWFNFAMTKPCENFLLIKDHQMRIVRNSPHIGFEPNRRMHERLIDFRTNETPTFYTEDSYGGPFHDHFHMHFRRTQPGKKEANEENYQRLERGEAMLP